jgi:resuscitation-promoting factor RpfA
MLRADPKSRFIESAVSENDPKTKKLEHAVPAATPPALQKALQLDRRTRDNQDFVPLDTLVPARSQSAPVAKPSAPPPVPGARSAKAPPSNIAPSIPPVTLLVASRPSRPPVAAPKAMNPQVPQTRPSGVQRPEPVAPHVPAVPRVAPLASRPPSPVEFAQRQVNAPVSPAGSAPPGLRPIAQPSKNDTDNIQHDDVNALLESANDVPTVTLRPAELHHEIEARTAPLPVASKAKPAAAPETKSASAREVVAAPARVWQRIGAFAIDAAILAGLVFALVSVAAKVVQGADASNDWFGTLVRLATPALALLCVFGLVYATLAAVFFRGRTAGRFVFQIRLVDRTGDEPTLIRALLRAALAVLSFSMLLAGFWLALFDRKGQTLHDKLAGTFVVRSVT